MMRKTGKKGEAPIMGCYHYDHTNGATSTRANKKGGWLIIDCIAMAFCVVSGWMKMYNT